VGQERVRVGELTAHVATYEVSNDGGPLDCEEAKTNPEVPTANQGSHGTWTNTAVGSSEEVESISSESTRPRRTRVAVHEESSPFIWKQQEKTHAAQPLSHSGFGGFPTEDFPYLPSRTSKSMLIKKAWFVRLVNSRHSIPAIPALMPFSVPSSGKKLTFNGPKSVLQKRSRYGERTNLKTRGSQESGLCHASHPHVEGHTLICIEHFRPSRTSTKK